MANDFYDKNPQIINVSIDMFLYFFLPQTMRNQSEFSSFQVKQKKKKKFP